MKTNTITILAYLQQLATPIIAPCGGKGVCGKCQIIVHNKKVEISEKDQMFITTERLQEGYRLACDHVYQEGMEFLMPSISGSILTSTKIKTTLKFHYHNLTDLGCVVDIGTTTVVIQVLQLCDGKVVASTSFFNPQTRYGSDVITRIQFSNEHELHECTTCIREAIHLNLSNILKQHSIVSNHIKQMMICGNTTMIHFLLDYPTKSLGEYPFTVFEKGVVKKKYKQLFQVDFLDIEVVCFPHISAFVGGDIVSGIIACNLDQEKDISMLIDLGTNGELVVGNKSRMYVSSTAAGPAFEGGNITCGGGSIAGAISDVRYVDDIFHYQTIHNERANSICGSGLISFISECLSHHIMDETGAFIKGEERFYIHEEVFVCVKDVREFQLAKAAIQSGISLLMKQYGCEFDQLSHIYISGGFGTHLKKEHLISIGLLPERVLSKIEMIHNSALSGLQYTILSDDIKRAETVAKKAENINLAELSEFTDTLLDAMFFE